VTSTFAILWETFGLLGLASAAAWAFALLFLVAGIPRRHRWSRWLVATGAAAAGVMLAAATSASIRSIEIDRSAEVLAAEAAGTQAVQEKLRSRAANIRFAEDTVADQADVAGVTVAEEEGAYERAVEEQLEKIPAYRARGKKARASAKAAATGDTAAPSSDAEATNAGGADLAAAVAEPQRDVRKLPESQLMVADRFDRGNRGLAWTALAVALGLIGMEYVRRFSSTFDPVWPLPLTGTPVDGLCGKEHVVSLPPGGFEALPAWLESLVRRGESFVLFATNDPLAGRSELPRLSLPQISLPRVSLPRFQLSTPVRAFSATDVAADPSLAELAFESAWFGRGSTVITGATAAGDVLAQFAAALESRRHCRAAAGRTLDIIWALDSEPPAAAAATLARLAAATNVRWARP
jgi:hypothetical protein